MNTITIYKVTCTKAYMMAEQGTSYRLTPWGDNTAYYEGYDDGGSEYTLPEGYFVANCNAGSREIYDATGKHCPLLEHNGKPAIMTRSGWRMLQQA